MGALCASVADMYLRAGYFEKKEKANIAIKANSCYFVPMKKTVVKAIPEIFSLRLNGDYSRFVVQGGAGQMMSDTWTDIGRRLNKAVEKVGHDVEKKQAV